MLNSKIVAGVLSMCLTAFAGSSIAATDSNTTTTMKASETTSQYVKGSTITAKVKAKLLADSDISSMHISVKTVKRVVILTGTVKTEDQKQKAETIASEVDGVKAVKNHIVVKSVR